MENDAKYQGALQALLPLTYFRDENCLPNALVSGWNAAVRQPIPYEVIQAINILAQQMLASTSSSVPEAINQLVQESHRHIRLMPVLRDIALAIKDQGYNNLDSTKTTV